MALELFKPFVVKRLEEIQRIGVKDALKKIEKAYENPCVWDALENVIKEHPVLLNRAPTLHRLSIQAFEPVLVEGRAIKLHPLVCTAFNADFDGDQMPVHVPLSAEAQAEARFLMLSANNLLKPMDGRAVAVPSQDMILGSYYLTMDKAGEPGEGKVFRDFDEAMMAYDNGALGLHAPIKVRKTLVINGVEKTKLINATLGRLIFNRPIPQDLGFVSRDTEDSLFELEIQTVVKKKELGKLIDYCIKQHGFAVCAEMLDSIKEMGYKYSTRASFSISVYDMTIPDSKKDFIAAAQKKVDAINATFDDGLLTDEERYNNVIKVWEKTTNDVTDALQKGFDQFNPIKIMSDSGARGSIAQMRQLAGMRGLMFATNGKTIELPIKSNFREGLNILEYFMGAKGSRKSLSDTALRTADSGYLTRRLVDVSQDVIVREEKCDTTKGAWVEQIIDENNNTVLENLQDRIMGRYTIGEIVNPKTGEVIVGDDEMISEEQANAIVKAGIEKVYIRTVIQCHAKHGICAHCYGADLASGNPVKLGEAVGIIAAQSIGEPGTQLTMRTFHSGGVAGSDITQGLPRVEELFEARTPKKTSVLAESDGTIERIEPGDAPNTYIIDLKTPDGDMIQHIIPFGKRVTIGLGDYVSKGDSLTDGSKAPSDIRRIFDDPSDPNSRDYLDKIYEYIVKETQKVYRSQSCNVNDKHIEIIARQMTRKIRVFDKGDTELLVDSLVDMTEFEAENLKIQARCEAGEDLRVALGKPELLGITKASLQTESFLSAASFQETTKVLTDAAIRGKVDHLIGLKENVIIGKLIPAGTGMAMYHNVDVKKSEPVAEPTVAEELEQDAF
jgi:DNA-directed RNA polymerase subunit beta'